MLLHLFLHLLSGFQTKSCGIFFHLILVTLSPKVNILYLSSSSYSPPYSFFLLLFLLLLLLLPELRSFELFRLHFNFLR